MARRVGYLGAAWAVVTIATTATATWSTFNEDEGKRELNAARARAADCSKVSGVTGTGKIKITIGNGGQVKDLTMVSVPPKMDEKTDACVRGEFQKMRVTPFEGDVVVVSGAFVLL